MNVSKNMHLDGYFQVFTFHRFLFIILRSDFLACVCVCVCASDQLTETWGRCFGLGLGTLPQKARQAVFSFPKLCSKRTSR